MKLTRCRFEFKMEDAWVGFFWRTTHATTDQGIVPCVTDIWICIVPCVPIHLTLFHRVLIDIPKDSNDGIES